MVKGELKTLRITLEATTEAVIAYVYLQDISPSEVADTRRVAPDVSADFDAHGNLLGLEFLHAQKADAALMNRLASELDAPELAGIDLARMCAGRTQ